MQENRLYFNFEFICFLLFAEMSILNLQQWLNGQFNACKNDEIGKRRNAVMKVHSVLKRC